MFTFDLFHSLERRLSDGGVQPWSAYNKPEFGLDRCLYCVCVCFFPLYFSSPQKIIYEERDRCENKSIKELVGFRCGSVKSYYKKKSD